MSKHWLQNYLISLDFSIECSHRKSSVISSWTTHADSVHNSIDMKKHTYSKCQRFHVKCKGFLQMLLLMKCRVCLYQCLIISWELHFNLYCYPSSPKSYCLIEIHTNLYWNITTMFHVLVRNYQIWWVIEIEYIHHATPLPPTNART